MLDWRTDQHAKSYNIFLVKLTDTQPWMNFFTQITTKLKFYPNSLCSLNTVLTLLFCELWKHGWKHWVMHKITQVVKNIKCFNNYIHIIHSKQLHLGLLKQSDHKITILHWGVPDLALVVCLCVRQVITTPGVCCTADWVTITGITRHPLKSTHTGWWPGI